jgi:thiamine biosynthesis lipoprotein
MSMPPAEIHVFRHHAMATAFEVRIAGEDRLYAAQTAASAFEMLDRLESLLSRFRENSDISQIARLEAGATLRLSEPTFTCLQIAQQMEAATRSAFSVTPRARATQPEFPRWQLLPAGMMIRCVSGNLDMDLGAIGKGFAIDRMAEQLREWDCARYLLVAGGSSVLAGAAPEGLEGWSSGLGEDDAGRRFLLKNCSLSGSGVAVKGLHVIDPRTGQASTKRARAWALAETAAESDALSTACMVLDESEIADVVAPRGDWLVLLKSEYGWKDVGRRPLPASAASSS